MKSVLIICPFAKPDVGGVESHLDKLTSYLEAQGWAVTLVTYTPLVSHQKPPLYERKGNIEIIRMPWFGKGWFRKLEPYFPANFIYLFPGLLYKALLVYLKDPDRFSVIHAHGLISSAIANVLTTLCPKRKVSSTHAIYSLSPGSFKAKLFKSILGGFDKVLAVGEPSKQELIKIGIAPEACEVHPNWIDVEHYRPMDQAQARKELGLPLDKFIVMFIGRMIEIKGELLLLEAAQKTQLDIHFAFAGEGGFSEKVKEEAKKNPRVHYLGRIDDAQIVPAYNAADLFASPVLYDEGFATVYLEALSCGTPVLTSHRGCLPFFLDSSVATLLQDTNAEKVQLEIEAQFQHRDHLEEKKQLCRSYAEQNFSEKNAEIILNSYSS